MPHRFPGRLQTEVGGVHQVRSEVVGDRVHARYIVGSCAPDCLQTLHKLCTLDRQPQALGVSAQDAPVEFVDLRVSVAVSMDHRDRFAPGEDRGGDITGRAGVPDELGVHPWIGLRVGNHHRSAAADHFAFQQWSVETPGIGASDLDQCSAEIGIVDRETRPCQPGALFDLGEQRTAEADPTRFDRRAFGQCSGRRRVSQRGQRLPGAAGEVRAALK